MAKAVTGRKHAQQKPTDGAPPGARRKLAPAEQTMSALPSRSVPVAIEKAGTDVDLQRRKEALKNAALRAAARRAATAGAQASPTASAADSRPARKSPPPHKKR